MIGIGATWDAAVMFNVGNAISDEARAQTSHFNKYALKKYGQ